jgi:hypothetical protein
MIPLCEIGAERKHAQMNRELEKAPHSGAPKLSLVDRMPEINMMLRESPNSLTELAEAMGKLRHVVNAAPVMGYSGHPDWQPIAASRFVIDDDGQQHSWLGSSHIFSSIAKKIVYHLDLQSQFMDLSHVVQSWGKQSRHITSTPTSNLKATLACAMFREVVSSSTFYSLPHDSEFRSLGDALNVDGPSLEEACDGVDDAFAFEVDGVGFAPPVAVDSPHVFFRVVFGRLGAQKFDKCDQHLGFGSDEIAVTQHIVRSIDRVRSVCSVESHPAGLVSGSSGADLFYILRGCDLPKVFGWSACGPVCESNVQLPGVHPLLF